MFLSSRNEPPNDVQELIANPNGKATAANNDMERGRLGDSGAASTSSAISPSDQTVYNAESSGSNSRSSFCAKYFSVKSFLLLVCVTVSLVILPLILPPLPPPPSLLMLIPVAMLVLLLALAFMAPSGGRDVTGPACL